MALPTLDKTWQFNVNQLIVSAAEATFNKNLLFALKESLKNFAMMPWIVQYSCDSVTAGTVGDLVDRWVTAANIVGAGTAVGRSWIVLRSPNGCEICWHCFDNTTGVPNNIRNMEMVYSHGGLFTGGTTTARPTATDESVQFTSSSGSWQGGSTVADTRLHVLHTTDGLCTRIFLARASTVFFWWQVERLKSHAAGHTLPYTYRFTLAPDVSTSRTTRAFLSGQTTSLSSRIGTLNINQLGIFPGRDAAVAASVLGETYAQVADEVDGDLYCYEIGQITSTIGARGPKGLLFDIWAAQTPPAQTGDHYPADGSRQFVHIGHFMHPWNGTVIQLA
jgi:hypothetical protein